MPRNKRDPEYAVIGIDTETMDGPPITLQFYSEHVRSVNDCIFIGKRDATSVMLDHFSKLPPGNYRVYGHNLEFDAISLLWAHRHLIVDGDIALQIGDWDITGRYSRPIFLRFSDGSRYLEMVDSLLWFAERLEVAAKRVCPHLPKLERPPQLGEKLFTAKDTDFVAYAMRDAEVAFFLGVEVERFHKELDIPAQISLASMASTVFRKHYMQADIYQPPLYEWMVGAASSYHGGVNRVNSETPTWHVGVTALDISSAYPHAMLGLPDFSQPIGYKRYAVKPARRVKSVPEHGIFKVSGTAAKCAWPALFDHDFKPLKGKFEDIWTTSHELNAALDHGEVELRAISGFYYDAPCSYSPFAEYSRTFYKLKADKSLPSVLQYMYKILLNSLTGKFIQTQPEYVLMDGHLKVIRRAGGLYHPMIASLITGHTRGRIHDLEHEYKALHTATDGIFVPKRIEMSTKKELGAVLSEGFGDLALLRNKLYIFYTDSVPKGLSPDKQPYQSVVYKGRYIQKMARHGYQGTIATLEAMILNGEREYKVHKPVKLKTAMRGDGIPNKFVTSKRTLNVPERFKVIYHV